MSIIRFGIPLVGSVALSFAVFACSSDDKTTGGTPDAGGSTGGATGSGGGAATGGSTTASGGKTGSGGGTSATGGTTGDAGDPYVCQAAPPRDPGKTGAEHSACCQTSLGFKAGECLKKADVQGSEELKGALGHDDCSPDLFCAPTASALADAGNLGVYAECTSTSAGGAGLEGRCLPKCFVQGNPLVGQLKQDGCLAADLVCTPCYNPIDGTATGACTQKEGDAPKEAKPANFKTCGGGVDGGVVGSGICIPKTVVDASGNPAGATLKQDECDAGDLCVPTLKAKDLSACFAQCKVTDATILGLPGGDYSNGACVPTFVVRDTNPSGLALLKQATCADGELCAPCLNPLDNGKPTHACE